MGYYGGYHCELPYGHLGDHVETSSNPAATGFSWGGKPTSWAKPKPIEPKTLDTAAIVGTILEDIRASDDRLTAAGLWLTSLTNAISGLLKEEEEASDGQYT